MNLQYIINKLKDGIPKYEYADEALTFLARGIIANQLDQSNISHIENHDTLFFHLKDIARVHVIYLNGLDTYACILQELSESKRLFFSFIGYFHVAQIPFDILLNEIISDGLDNVAKRGLIVEIKARF